MNQTDPEDDVDSVASAVGEDQPRDPSALSDAVWNTLLRGDADNHPADTCQDYKQKTTNVRE